jgi:hypothetical protein
MAPTFSPRSPLKSYLHEDSPREFPQVYFRGSTKMLAAFNLSRRVLSVGHRFSFRSLLSRPITFSIVCALFVCAQFTSSFAEPPSGGTLVSIQVQPDGTTMALGKSQTFQAWGRYSNGLREPLTPSWSSSSSGVATVNSSGLVLAKSKGATTITAAVGGIRGTASLRVGQPISVSMSISPTSPSVSVGTLENFASTTFYSDGSSRTSTSWSHWTSSNPSVANITKPGVVNALNAGTTTITVSDGSGRLEASTVLTVTQINGSGPTTPISPSFFGIHTDMSHTVWPYVPTHGWRSLDAGITWSNINTANGVYDWTLFDSAIANAQANKVDILYTIDATPIWAAANGGRCRLYFGSCDPPDDLNTDGTGTNQHYKDFLTALMAHVGPGKIKYFEVWNEPNIAIEWVGSVAQVVRMAQDAQSIIKATDPNAIILGPAPSSYNADYQTSMLAAGLGKYVDGFSYHGYAYHPEDLIKIIGLNQAAFKQYGYQNKPFVDTEGSWGQFQSCDSQCMQYFTARWYLIQMAMGINRVFWFGWDFTDTGEFYNKATQQLTLAGTTEETIYNWTAGGKVGQVYQAGNTYYIPIVSPSGYQDLAVWNTGGTTNYQVPAQYQGHPYYNLQNTATTAGSTVVIGENPILFTSTVKN